MDLKKLAKKTEKAIKKVDGKKWVNRLASAGEVGKRVSDGIMGEASINPSGVGSGLSFNPYPAPELAFGSEHREHERREHHSRHRHRRKGDIHVHVHTG